jgi:hypothetical protein
MCYVKAYFINGSIYRSIQDQSHALVSQKANHAGVREDMKMSDMIAYYSLPKIVVVAMTSHFSSAY